MELLIQRNSLTQMPSTVHQYYDVCCVLCLQMSAGAGATAVVLPCDKMGCVVCG
jgi:hypothetical protein